MKPTLGTVDCTMHPELCEAFKIQSYPTQILVNQSHPFVALTGHPSIENIKIFIHDLKHPAYENLSEDSFYDRVQSRPLGELWLVYFTLDNCGMCEHVKPEIRLLAKRMTGIVKIAIGKSGDIRTRSSSDWTRAPPSRHH